MNTDKLSDLVFYVGILLIVGSTLLYTQCTKKKTKETLLKDGKSHFAIIKRFSKGSKTARYFHYEYLVDNKKFNSFERYPYDVLLEIGDTLEIMYSVSDPEIHEVDIYGPPLPIYKFNSDQLDSIFGR